MVRIDPYCGAVSARFPRRGAGINASTVTTRRERVARTWGRSWLNPLHDILIRLRAGGPGSAGCPLKKERRETRHARAQVVSKGVRHEAPIKKSVPGEGGEKASSVERVEIVHRKVPAAATAFFAHDCLPKDLCFFSFPSEVITL